MCYSGPCEGVFLVGGTYHPRTFFLSCQSRIQVILVLVDVIIVRQLSKFLVAATVRIAHAAFPERICFVIREKKRNYRIPFFSLSFFSFFFSLPLYARVKRGIRLGGKKITASLSVYQKKKKKKIFCAWLGQFISSLQLSSVKELLATNTRITGCLAMPRVSQ